MYVSSRPELMRALARLMALAMGSVGLFSCSPSLVGKVRSALSPVTASPSPSPTGVAAVSFVILAPSSNATAGDLYTIEAEAQDGAGLRDVAYNGTVTLSATVRQPAAES